MCREGTKDGRKVKDGRTVAGEHKEEKERKLTKRQPPLVSSVTAFQRYQTVVLELTNWDQKLAWLQIL